MALSPPNDGDPEIVRAAVLGNAGSLIAFCVAAANADFLAPGGQRHQPMPARASAAKLPNKKRDLRKLRIAELVRRIGPSVIVPLTVACPDTRPLKSLGL